MVTEKGLGAVDVGVKMVDDELGTRDGESLRLLS